MTPRRREPDQAAGLHRAGLEPGRPGGALRQGVAQLEDGGDVVAVSPLYETEPVGGPEDQGAFLNVVVELATADTPQQLLRRCQALEEAAHRVRTVRFGPRTLDADVLLVGDLVVDEPDLIVPHPRMWERRFVLQPLVRPGSRAGAGRAALLAAGGEVVRVGSL